MVVEYTESCLVAIKFFKEHKIPRGFSRVLAVLVSQEVKYFM